MTPEGWADAVLADIVRPDSGLQTGPFGAQLHASDYVDQGIPVVMPKDLRGGRIVTDSVARVPEQIALELARHRVEAGDILFGRRGDIGRCGLVAAAEVGWLCGTGCLRARPNVDRVDARFIVQQITWSACANWLIDHAVGQTMLNLNTEILGRLPILLPPLPEQRKIAAILSSVDDAIEASQAVIDQLQVVKKAMMAELLTRGLPGRHTKFKMTEIGEVPEEWELVRLGKVSHVAYGLTVNAQRRQSSATRPYLTVANVQDDDFDLAAVKHIGTLPGDEERYLLHAGDLLIVEGNANPDRLGRAFLWQSQVPGALHQNHLIRARPSADVEARWLALNVNGEHGRRHIRDHATTSSGLHTINSGVVAQLPVSLPRARERASIIQAYDSQAARIASERSYLECLRDVKSALMSVLLTGEVRVTPDEDAA